MKRSYDERSEVEEEVNLKRILEEIYYEKTLSLHNYS